MWLFDELLKKPPQPANDTTGSASSQQQGGQWDDSVIQAESVKIEKTEEQSIMTESLEATLPGTPAEPIITAESDNSAVLVGATAEEAAATQEEVPEATDALAEVENAPVLETVNDTQETPIQSSTPEAPAAEEDTPMSDILNATSDTSLLNFGTDEEEKENPEDTIQVESEFDSLKTYIETNIDQSESLIMKIDAAHTAKLEEAAGYKSEKERFASLEEDAYKDAERLMIEKGHAERMKSYFIEQLQADAAQNVVPQAEWIELSEDHLFYDEPPAEEDITLIDDTGIDGSVETALTGLAVQNTVKNTVEKKHKSKKHEETKEENFSLI